MGNGSRTKDSIKFREIGTMGVNHIRVCGGKTIRRGWKLNKTGYHRHPHTLLLRPLHIFLNNKHSRSCPRSPHLPLPSSEAVARTTLSTRAPTDEPKTNPVRRGRFAAGCCRAISSPEAPAGKSLVELSSDPSPHPRSRGRFLEDISLNRPASLMSALFWKWWAVPESWLQNSEHVARGKRSCVSPASWMRHNKYRFRSSRGVKSETALRSLLLVRLLGPTTVLFVSLKGDQRRHVVKAFDEV